MHTPDTSCTTWRIECGPGGFHYGARVRLTGLELRNYRRFSSEDLDLSEPLVAMTGPNEAGKSSLLRAISLLDRDEPVNPRDTTRGMTLPEEHILVRGLFRLDAADRAAIAHLHDAQRVQHFVPIRRRDGEIGTGVYPAPRRAPGLIEDAIKQLNQTLAKLARRKRNVLPAAAIAAIESALSDITAFRDKGWNGSQEGDGLSATRDALQGALEELETDEVAAKLIDESLDAIGGAIAARREDHPFDSMRRLLYKRRPSVISFRDSERDLRATYDLTSAADNPPDALVNIAALARLSLPAVRDARNAGDYGRVEGLLDAANDELRVALANWSQSSLTLRLRMDENVLRLLVTTPDRSWLTDITERSDGLRSYIALVAAIAWARRDTDSARPTLLLLDEAEQHLHYDAQADLVEVLSSGRLAHQVVYTTHSAGCLPEDLGAAVRVILPHSDTERSRIQNWFWESGPGFSPLIFGMGASSLAFSSARRAVLTEGASDTIALPSLLKEALGVERLGYQVAPGLAEVGRSAARELDLEAARVVYLVDGDSAGCGIRDKLKSADVVDDDIVSLGGQTSGVTLEDLLTPAAFREAAKAALRRGGSTHAEVPIATPQFGRASALKKSCESAGITPPSKRVLAQEIVILARESPVLSGRGAQILCQLHGAIAQRLNLPPG